MSTSGDGSTTATAKRKRGRAQESKNKPKHPAATTIPGHANLQTHVLKIPAGGDVAETVAAFARGCRNFGVCVLSAFGAIAAAVLWEASSNSSTLITFRGSFDLISMTATFLPGGSKGGLAVTLAGEQGQVVGGVVAGQVIAAGTVIVVAATFASPAFHCSDLINNTSPSMLPVIDGSSMVVDGGEAKNLEKGLSAEYLQQVEQLFELQPVAGGHVGGEEVDRDMLENRMKELQQCLELPTAGGGASSASSGGGAGDQELFVEPSEFPTVVDGAFGSGRDGWGEHFAFDSFRVSDVCPLLY